MKTFKEATMEKDQIDELVNRAYDISDWPEDGIDDIEQELRKARAKVNKDYEIRYKKGKHTHIVFKSNKAKSIEKAFFMN